MIAMGTPLLETFVCFRLVFVFFFGWCSSSSTWALMPPKPNALTAARRGVFLSRVFQGAACVGTQNGLSLDASCAAGVAKFAAAGSCFACIDSSTLISPAAPAAVSK